MCMCKTPNKNGEVGYSWSGEPAGVHPVNPPSLQPGDVLLYDGPGRCTHGLDYHSWHYRVVTCGERTYLLARCREEEGEERLDFGRRPGMPSLLTLDDDAVYWALQLIHYAYHSGSRAVYRAGAYRAGVALPRAPSRNLQGRGAGN